MFNTKKVKADNNMINHNKITTSNKIRIILEETETVLPVSLR